MTAMNKMRELLRGRNRDKRLKEFPVEQVAEEPVTKPKKKKATTAKKKASTKKKK